MWAGTMLRSRVRRQAGLRVAPARYYLPRHGRPVLVVGEVPPAPPATKGALAASAPRRVAATGGVAVRGVSAWGRPLWQARAVVWRCTGGWPFVRRHRRAMAPGRARSRRLSPLCCGLSLRQSSRRTTAWCPREPRCAASKRGCAWTWSHTACSALTASSPFG